MPAARLEPSGQRDAAARPRGGCRLSEDRSGGALPKERAARFAVLAATGRPFWAGFATANGVTNWLEGVMLTGVYAIFGLALFWWSGAF